ncbi:MAG: tetratricopeptide repeat protein, partial [Spirochaetota bacterium]
EDGSLKVSFIMGKVLVSPSQGKPFTAPYIGMTLQKKSTIKTGKDSFLEFQSASSRYTVQADTKIMCEKAVSGDKTRKKPETGISKLFSGIAAPQRSTIAGIRAEKRTRKTSLSDGAGISSPSSDKNVYAQMQQDFSEGKYSELIIAYEKDGALQNGANPEIDLLAAKSYLLLCRYGDAVRLCDKVIASRIAPAQMKGDAFISASLSCRAVLDYEGSNRYAGRYLEKYPKGESAVQAFYLCALNFRSLGEKKKAENNYKAIIKNYPSDPLAESAGEELKALSE